MKKVYVNGKVLKTELLPAHRVSLTVARFADKIGAS